jgi:ketosteroid isomerase-like protein
LNGAADAKPDDARRLRCQAAKQYLRSGRTSLGIALAEQVLSEVGIERPLRAQPLLLQMLVQRVESLFASRRFVAREQAEVPARARAQMEVCRALFRELGAAFPVAGTHVRMQLLRLAHETGDVTALLDALAWDAIAAAAQGGWLGRRRCKATLAKLEPVVEAVGTFGARALYQLTLSYTLTYSARFSEAVAPARAGMQAFAQLADRGTYWEENSLAAMYFVSLGHMGQVAAIVSEAQTRRREARERDDVPATILLLLTECLGCLATDRPDDALDLLHRHQPMLDPGAFNNLHMSMMFRTVDTHLYCDRPDAALAYVDQVWASFRASAYRLSQFARTMANYNRARALVGVAAQAPSRATMRRARAGVRALGREDTEHARALAQLLQAALHHVRGEHDQAVHLLETAEHTFRTAGEMLYASSARVSRALIQGDASALRTSHDAIRATGVVRPDLWARTWSPGFRASNMR